MDDETKLVVGEQRQITKLTETDGWSFARKKLVEKVLDLQNAFNVNDDSAEMLLIDIRARKLATSILYDWLKDIEGTKEQYDSNKLTLNTKPYILRE
jgi:hypothetical protein